MSFIPFIRDYIELLNTVYDSFSNDNSVQQIIQQTFLYIAGSLKFILLYIITFQWFRDILYLPIVIPKISNSIFKETFFLQAPLENFFTILEIPTYNGNKFLIGFLNSFFLTLPISCAHLIYLRRLLIQGKVAGIAAALGNIFGQLFFITSVVFGFRFLIISWFSLEPVPYILGLVLLLTIIYDMVHERVIKIINWNNQTAILKIFYLNFLLIWTEQSCIFQYLGNISVAANSSLIESSLIQNDFSFFSTHLFYLLGLFLGSIFFNILFALVFLTINEFLQIRFAILRSTWINRLNVSLLTLTLAFTFSSIPFYGIDYLLTKPLGFISQDKVFKNTIFSPNEIEDPFGILGGFSDNLSLNTDVNSFDRGLYLKSPISQTFEDLNYSGEYALTIRQGSIPLFEQYKEKARKIREILVKKSDNDTSEKDFVDKKTEIKKINQQFSQQEKEKFAFEYPTYYPIDKNLYSFSNIQTRFEKTYKESPNTLFEFILEGTLNNVFADEQLTVLYSELDQKLKQKFYSNPVYKFLLNSDIDTFLKRQPNQYLLSPTEEANLYKKRLILARYNDSLRFYNTLPYTEEFQHFFNGSKSFIDRVYNQQFKGTLHIVRRLFTISLNSTESNPHQLIMKYDQPLFKLKNNSLFNSLMHEELEDSIKFSNSIDNKSDEFNSEISEIDINNRFGKFPNRIKSPMIELVGQSPFYLGWDEDLRKIILTNRLLSASITNFSEPQLQIKNQKNYSYLNKTDPIEFTTWPVTKNSFNDPNSNITFSTRYLFETKTRVENMKYNNLIPFFGYQDNESGISYYESLPNNVVKLASGIVDVIPPNRGGFVWPGTSNLKFSIKNIFKF